MPNFKKSLKKSPKINTKISFKFCQPAFCLFLCLLSVVFSLQTKAYGYETYLNRAVKLHKKYNYDAAIANYNKAIQIAESQQLARRNKPPQYEYYEDPYTGEMLEREIESYEENFTDLYFNRGLAKSDAGYAQEALYDFNKSIELDPKNDSAIFNRGIVKYELGLYNQALKDFDWTISLVPGDAKALYNRAMTKYQLKDIRGALRDAKLSKRYFKDLRQRKEAREVANFIEYVKMERSF